MKDVQLNSLVQPDNGCSLKTCNEIVVFIVDDSHYSEQRLRQINWTNKTNSKQRISREREVDLGSVELRTIVFMQLVKCYIK